jgi:hypothetical protein
MRQHCPSALPALLAILSLMAAGPAAAVVGENPSQYKQRYGAATHEMNIDEGHPGLIYQKKPYAIFAAFEGGRSVGEMIFKTNGMSEVDIANLLKQNSPGWSWRKENIVMGKGDEEKMRAQGIVKVEIWTRIDDKCFATFVRMVTGDAKTRTQLDALLVGTQEGVKLVTEMASMNKQWVPKPMK